MKKLIFTLITSLVTTVLFLQDVGVAQITGSWSQTGPIAFPTNISGQIHGIGRTTQLKFDPVDINTIWATTASGGLYVSHDNGHNWSVTGTDVLPPLNCASVCIDFTDHDILYLGTGDPNYYYESYGVYKSTDGGATFFSSNSGIGNRMALELLMKPDDHNTIIAATDDGIFKTVDGGANWVEKKANGAFTDMVFKPDHDGVIYAVDYDGNYFRSSDWGESWDDLSGEITIPGGGTAGGSRLGVSAANASIVYLSVIANQCSVFRSNDAGLSFTLVKTDYPNLNGYSATEGGQGNYNFDMEVDPDDADKVYVIGHVVWKSTDGGANFTQLTEWYADCHTDMHHLLHNPADHTMLLNANDGGIFVSYDEGDNWDEYADGLGATEIYHAAQSKLSNTIVSIGTQDNGELYYGDPTWYCNRGGDWGARMWFDFLTYNRVYYYNGYRRIVTGGDQSWNAPFADPDAASVRMAFTPASPETGYVTQKEVWRCDNLSSSSPDWTQLTTIAKEGKALGVSPADANNVWVARSDSKLMHTTNGLDIAPTWTTITSPVSTNTNAGFAISKYDADIVYLYGYNFVYRTDDAGVTWSNITYDLPLINIAGMYLDDFSDDESIYIANANGVYYHNISMDHWDNYGTGLPSVANIQDIMMYNDGSPNSVLRVGYYGKGVWESALYQPHPIPAAEFTVDERVICTGSSVHFTNASTDNAETFLWTFEGGTPASSTDENPVVNYADAGVYNVTLTATNVNGSDNEIKDLYITVSPVNTIPLTEGFQDDFLPDYWIAQDANSDNVFWQQTSTAGGYDLSSKSALFDNFYNPTGGARDGLETPQYDLSLATSATLYFDYAYAKYSNDYPDSLEILLTKDCGISWQSLWLRSGDGLATAPDYTADLWVPGADDWKTDSIDLSAYLGEEQIAITFQNIGHYGQGIYLDNVNLKGEVPLEIQNISTALSIYPNPVQDILSVRFLSDVSRNISVILINDIGETVWKQAAELTAGRTQVIPVNMKEISAGIYIIRLQDSSGTLAENKIVKL